MELKKLIEKERKSLLKKKNVIGYSGTLQPKITNNVETNEMVFRVYVSKKEDISSLSERDLVPKTIGKACDEIKTDIVEIGEIKALSDVRDKHRPIVAGISGMGLWANSTACTVGNYAVNMKKGEEQFLGVIVNNHCGAKENLGVKGIYYLQPSPYDKGKASDKIGTLWRFVTIKFAEYNSLLMKLLLSLFNVLGRPENLVDIALIKINCEYLCELYSIGKLYGKRRPVLGESVQKIGRTTGLTTNGVVYDLSWNGFVSYRRGKAFYSDCVLIIGSKFSQGGDSSSPIVSKGDRPELLAQLFAGSNNTSIGCYIDNIERLLDVDVYPFTRAEGFNYV